MKLKRFLVHFKSRIYGETTITIHDYTAEAACKYVVDHGIGSYDGDPVFPDQILGVEETVSAQVV